MHDEHAIGRSELRRLRDSRNLVPERIGLFHPYETAFITLVFHSVGTLLFATNHTQNVIETVRLFDDLDALRSDPDAFGFFKKMEPSHSSSGPPRKFAYITPITGGETLISFTDVTIEE
ncbi:MAG: hypothetical protein WBE71_05720 [Xanthobacteraceae bacterium]